MARYSRSTMTDATAPGSVRILLARRFAAEGASRFARFVTWVSFIGLMLGVMVLTLVICVMNGFDRELKSRLLQSIPHVTIADAGKTDTAFAQAGNIEGVLAVHEYYRGVGAISALGDVQPVAVYGIGPESAPSLAFIAQHMQSGALTDLFAASDGIILGAPLARYLGLSVGDVIVMVAVQTSEQSVKPSIQRYTLRGTFALGAEPDYNLVLVNLQRYGRAEWASMGNLGLQVQLSDPLQASRVAATLSAQGVAGVESWEYAYGELFQAVRLEKSMMFVLLLLVVAIASFNIIAGQTMLVNDKRAAIAILRTMGATRGLIRGVFLLQGIVIGAAGTVVGLVLGLAAALNIDPILGALQQLTGMHLLDGSFFVEVPVAVKPVDLTVVGLLSCGLSILAAWVPARRAALLDPVNALH